MRGLTLIREGELSKQVGSSSEQAPGLNHLPLRKPGFLTPEPQCVTDSPFQRSARLGFTAGLVWLAEALGPPSSGCSPFYSWREVPSLEGEAVPRSQIFCQHPSPQIQAR